MVDERSAVGVLLGEGEGFATAVTWLPSDVLRTLSAGDEPGDELYGLEAVAKAFELDLVSVPASAPWGGDALGRLRNAGVETAWIVAGPLSRLAERVGWMEVLRQTASAPGELAYALDEALHEVMQEVRLGLEARADVLILADELAGASGWLISPDYAIEALVPCYRHVVLEWSSRSDGTKAAVFHSDGDIRALLESLKHAGFSGVHLAPAGRASFEVVAAAAHEVGLCAVGGIETVSLSANGVRKTGEGAGRAARPGRVIIADDGGITTADEVAAFGAALAVAVETAIESEGGYH